MLFPKYRIEIAHDPFGKNDNCTLGKLDCVQELPIKLGELHQPIWMVAPSVHAMQIRL